MAISKKAFLATFAGAASVLAVTVAGLGVGNSPAQSQTAAPITATKLEPSTTRMSMTGFLNQHFSLIESASPFQKGFRALATDMGRADVATDVEARLKNATTDLTIPDDGKVSRIGPEEAQRFTATQVTSIMRNGMFALSRLPNFDAVVFKPEHTNIRVTFQNLLSVEPVHRIDPAFPAPDVMQAGAVVPDAAPRVTTHEPNLPPKMELFIPKDAQVDGVPRKIKRFTREGRRQFGVEAQARSEARKEARTLSQLEQQEERLASEFATPAGKLAQAKRIPGVTNPLSFSILIKLARTMAANPANFSAAPELQREASELYEMGTPILKRFGNGTRDVQTNMPQVRMLIAKGAALAKKLSRMPGYADALKKIPNARAHMDQITTSSQPFLQTHKRADAPLKL